MTSRPAAPAGFLQKRMDVFVVDDDDEFLEFLRTALQSELSAVSVTTYNSKRFGRPGADYDWSQHDVLLLDYDLGRGDTGPDWLKAFADRPGFPQTILLASEDSPTLDAQAILGGANAYLNKGTLTPDGLAQAVRDVMNSRALARRGVAVGRAAPPSKVADAVQGSELEYRGRSELDTGPGGASYRFIRLIGRGAMSRVYLSERSEDGTVMVLKILDSDVSQASSSVQRFFNEGEMLSRIDSPYVVKVFDHGMTNSYGYIAMEFFGRGDLAQRMNQPISVDDAVLYLHNIAYGLEAIARAGVVHRDLKPGNIMFRSDGSMALVDFGVSKWEGADYSLTQAGVILGTPYCMSPEQTAGLEIDHRTDLYAAGVIFHQMLTGRYPFTAATLPALLLAIQEAPIPTLAGKHARFQPVLDRLLAKKADDRYANARELIRALDEIVAADSQPQPRPRTGTAKLSTGTVKLSGRSSEEQSSPVGRPRTGTAKLSTGTAKLSGVTPEAQSSPVARPGSGTGTVKLSGVTPEAQSPPSVRPGTGTVKLFGLTPGEQSPPVARPDPGTVKLSTGTTKLSGGPARKKT